MVGGWSLEVAWGKGDGEDISRLVVDKEKGYKIKNKRSGQDIN